MRRVGHRRQQRFRFAIAPWEKKLDVRRFTDSFTDTELRSLEWAYAQARGDLGIGPDLPLGGARRQKLARIIFQLANGGELNAEVLRRRAVIRFLNSQAQSMPE
jgi:hypothetical protein